MICDNIGSDEDWDFSSFKSVMIPSSTLGVSAITILALTYLPGNSYFIT